ncbi:putative T7SS-secreted protein [Streptomyces sp. NPDC004533]|uniref:WXG100 family type VII secretion target n=1 Tax=Streptomyces sp. NPDC004533 TaxID=3154278 RepID=UPI0033AEBDFB
MHSPTPRTLRTIDRLHHQRGRDPGAGLDMVGVQGAAKSVDGWGDSVADRLGVAISEKELGDTDDPKELLHGDPARIREAAGHLRNFHNAFESTGSGLQRLDHDHWQGDAAEAFRAKFTPHAKQWLTAADACQKAADALETYAHAVEWAQGQAKQCLDQYTKASDAYQRAQTAYNAQIATYNAQVDRYNQAVSAGHDPGAAPTRPGKFDGDSYAAEMALAEMDLHRARAQRDSAARAAAQAVEAATNTAPKEPSFASRLLADGEDLAAGYSLTLDHVAGGVVKGAVDLVKFARGLNPMDPYNVAHPAMWLEQVSTTAAGMLHASNHRRPRPAAA